MKSEFQNESTALLTRAPMARPISMSANWRRVALIAALACGFASVRVMANPNVRRPVAQFMYFYQQSDDMNLWERVVFSCLLTKTSY
jgi:hypothetical protein